MAFAGFFEGFYFKWGEPRSYGPLGICETALKALAYAVGIASISVYQNNPNEILSPWRIAIGSILCAPGMLNMANLVHRIIDKELFAVIVMIFQIFANWILVVVTFLSPNPSAWVFTYLFLMILGEFIKLAHVFLVDETRVVWPKFIPNKWWVAGISIVYLVWYLILLVLQVISFFLDMTLVYQY